MTSCQNISASVKQRLLNRSKADNRSFNELLQYYAIERFLYRLSLLCYSRESAIAEKFEAMVKLGHLNSRMKDFYDIWLLSRQFRFELSKLVEAVRLTFKQRGTELNQPIEAFSADFISSRLSMWVVFRKRLKQDHVPASFQDIAAEVESFLAPVIKGDSEEKEWTPAGSWS